jgi:hypothetical protein
MMQFLFFKIQHKYLIFNPSFSSHFKAFLFFLISYICIGYYINYRHVFPAKDLSCLYFDIHDIKVPASHKLQQRFAERMIEQTSSYGVDIRLTLRDCSQQLSLQCEGVM